MMSEVEDKIPAEILERIPLFQRHWLDAYRRVREHPNAPLWRNETGDRLTKEDLPFVEEFRNLLEAPSPKNDHRKEFVLKWAFEQKKDSLWFSRALAKTDWERRFESVVTMRRRDLQDRIELIVPQSLDLERMIVNSSSGTTGQPIFVPTHPKVIACYDPLLQSMLRAHGVQARYDHDTTAAIQFCAQKKTITYHTVHSQLNGAAFAKINLDRGEWKNDGDAQRFIQSLNPVFLSGDPYAYLQALENGIEFSPQALVSTSIQMSRTTRQKLESSFRCPVVDFYSLNETGPIAYSCPVDPECYHLAAPDLYVELLDETGFAVPEGTSGEIVVTGGRNPYLPLLRYRTGDRARYDSSTCACGNASGKYTHLEARSLVILKNSKGESVNPLDVTRILRTAPIYFFQFVQKKDLSCRISIDEKSSLPPILVEKIHGQLAVLFGEDLPIEWKGGLDLSHRKPVPFVVEAS